jgi:CxxC motif-containing protein (DUF1111 family)
MTRLPLTFAALLVVIAVTVTACVTPAPPVSHVVDHPPDPTAAARAGDPLPGLTAAQLEMFELSEDEFSEIDIVTGSGETTIGLGPRFNLNGCAGCHGFPATGGTSGFVNPQPIVAKLDGARNDAEIPFLRQDGPIVEARFKWLTDADGKFLLDSSQHGADRRRADGGVHALFTIAGRSDARGCEISQPPFKQAWNLDNVSLRIPTPLFGLGLIEAIGESTIRANSLETMSAAAASSGRTSNDATIAYRKIFPDMAIVRGKVKMYAELGIVGRPGRGRENRSGNDSTITRFGWKAQNKSLLLFAGEAYNVEQGITNELFPNERDEEPIPLPEACKLNATPEDDTRLGLLGEPPPAPARSSAEQFMAIAGDLVKFELFMRMLAPPQAACDLAKPAGCTENIVRGSAVFDAIYCSACHVRQLKIGESSIAAITQQQYANLYSDLLLHKMGSCAPNADHTQKCLADGIAQGQAQGDEFRTAPLWGVGQRVFFLHDGRTNNLPTAILAHRGPGSEANAVIQLYERLPDTSKQDLIDFLRSL